MTSIAENAIYPFGKSSAAGEAFDSLASDYDKNFTDTPIGRAQRNAVWRVLASTFESGDSILELNCGTGEDAAFLAARGVTILACDASREMIATAERRHDVAELQLPIVFCQLATESIHQLQPSVLFDGAFSNFSGLNCVANIDDAANSLSALIKPSGDLIICCSTRYCLIETLYYLGKGQPRKAFRRWKGQTSASVGGKQFSVYYPTVSALRKQFAPHFRLHSYRGVGVAVPPSYLDNWSRRYPIAFRALRFLEPLVAKVPLLRVTGDHVLLHFKKVTP